MIHMSNDDSGVFPFVESQIFQMVVQRFHLRRQSGCRFLRKTRIIQSVCRNNAECCCSINIIPHESLSWQVFRHKFFRFNDNRSVQYKTDIFTQSI